MNSPEGIAGYNKNLKKDEKDVKIEKPKEEVKSAPIPAPVVAPPSISLAEAVKMTPQSISTTARPNKSLSNRKEESAVINKSVTNQKIKPGQIISF